MSAFAGDDAEHEDALRLSCLSLLERHRRRDAALEAPKVARDWMMSVTSRGPTWNPLRCLNPGLLGSLDAFHARLAHPIEH